MGNKTLGLNYYANMKDAPLSDLLRQAIIKTENQFIYFYDYSWQDFPYTGRSTGAYIMFYPCVPVDHGEHVPGTFAQSSA